MASLQWSEALALGNAVMDDTHREFVDLLARVHEASDDAVLPLWRELQAHTVEHFGQEDRWMQHTGFAAGNCHASQHDVILQIMNELARRAAVGDASLLKPVAMELGTWFVQHAQTMDTALAAHLELVGFDVLTGELRDSRVLQGERISGCGGAACSSTAADHESEPVARAGQTGVLEPAA